VVSELSRKLILTLLVMLSLTCFSFTSLHANAASSLITNFDINSVERVVQIQDGGLVVVQDIIDLSFTQENVEVQFPTGFPFEYSSNLVYCFAHSNSDSTEQLNVELDTGLGKLGFYGMEVTLPANTVIEDSYSLTVVSVFSGLTRSEAPHLVPEEPEPYWWWNVTFPLYPSLAQMASTSNVTIILPHSVEEISIEAHTNLVEKGLNVSATSIDSRQALQFLKTPLENFASESAWLRFWQKEPSDPFLLIEANEVKRDVVLDEWGHVTVSDFYHLTNKGDWNLTSIRLRLPQHAFDVSWIDETSGTRRTPSLEGNATTTYMNATIAFGTLIEKNEETLFTVAYNLPWTEYVTQKSWLDSDLVFSFFEREHFDWIIETLSVTVRLPQNADFQFCTVQPESVGETVTFAFHNVTSFHDRDFELSYGYVIFWASYYPTLWVGVFVAVVCIVALLWRAPKPTVIPVTPIASEKLRNFVDAYEKKTNAMRELETLDQQVRKKQIPRRRYKVRKKALEGRLSVLSKDLTGLKEEMRKAGARYAGAMRQIEVAETELEETESAMRRIELRYRRREISKGTYGKLMDEYTRRRERAETTIDGVLLRLREEIR